MTILDKTTHGVNALVCIAGCLTAADATATGGAGMGAFMSIKEIFRRGTPTQQAIYARTKAALDAALDNAHLTPDDRDKIHYAIKAGCPSEDTIIALGRDPQAVAEDMSKALSNTDATDTLRDTFVSIVASVLNDTLKAPDSARELASAYQKAVIDWQKETTQQIDGVPQQVVDLLIQQGLLTPGTSAVQTGDLITLAAKFEETSLTDASALVSFLTQKAEEYRSYKTLIDDLDERVAAIANLKGAAQHAAEQLNFDEVETLLARVDEVETTIAAETKEARASNALLRNRPDQAYAIFCSAADGFRELDVLEYALRRNAYLNQLYRHGLRYGGMGLVLAANVIRPAIAALKDTTRKDLWAGSTQNLASALQEQGTRIDGPTGTALLAEAVTAYRDALTICTRTDHPVDWAMTTQNLALALQEQGIRTDGPTGTALLAEAVTAYRDALTICTRTDHPVDWAMTTQNLAGALQEQGTRTDGPTGTALLAEAVTAYRDALTICTRADHPVQWATTHENLARAERALAQHDATADPNPHWDAALAYVDAALEVFDPVHMNYNHAEATRLRNLILARA